MDCNSLKAFSNKVHLNDRVHRWWTYLQTITFDIMYRESKRLAHVDFFSRNLVDLDHRKIDKIAEKEINLAEISEDWLLAEQRRDPQIIRITRKLQNGELAEASRMPMSYDKVLFTVKYNEKAEPSACPLSREALDGPLLTMCISQLCTWVGIKRSRNCTSITGSKKWRSLFANS